MPATPALPPLPVGRARSGAGTRVVASLPVPVSTSAPAPSTLLAAAGFRSEKCRFYFKLVIKKKKLLKYIFGLKNIVLLH